MRLEIKQQSRDGNGAVGSELVKHASVFSKVPLRCKKVMTASAEVGGLLIWVEVTKKRKEGWGDLG